MYLYVNCEYDTTSSIKWFSNHSYDTVQHSSYVSITPHHQTIGSCISDFNFWFFFLAPKPFAVMNIKEIIAIEVVAGRNVVIPCRPTSPDLQVDLWDVIRQVRNTYSLIHFCLIYCGTRYIPIMFDKCINQSTGVYNWPWIWPASRIYHQGCERHIWQKNFWVSNQWNRYPNVSKI